MQVALAPMCPLKLHKVTLHLQESKTYLCPLSIVSQILLIDLLIHPVPSSESSLSPPQMDAAQLFTELAHKSPSSATGNHPIPPEIAPEGKVGQAPRELFVSQEGHQGIGEPPRDTTLTRAFRNE